MKVELSSFLDYLVFFFCVNDSLVVVFERRYLFLLLYSSRYSTRLWAYNEDVIIVEYNVLLCEKDDLLLKRELKVLLVKTQVSGLQSHL